MKCESITWGLWGGVSGKCGDCVHVTIGSSVWKCQLLGLTKPERKECRHWSQAVVSKGEYVTDFHLPWESGTIYIPSARLESVKVKSKD
jgi:hypothetical protein